MRLAVQRSTLFIAILSAAAGAHAEDVDSFGAMISEGEATLDFRYRYEHVDQDSFDRSASANTLRSRLTLSTAVWQGFSALVEGDNVWDFNSDNYNSTENGNSDRPVIADPTGTDLNQLWLRYATESVDVTAGRQRILHGNQRFVGGVAWRQNEQTYDGFRGHWRPVQGLELDASYVAQVNRIFGPDDGANPAVLEGDNYLLRADYQVNEDHGISIYSYLLDIDADGPYTAGQTVNNSTDTYGLEYRGKFGPVSVGAAWAMQSDAGDSEQNYDANYYLAELGLNLDVVSLQAAYEVLGADNGVGFKTPLATLHKFQGWADQFLATPGDGIEDLSIGATATNGPVTLKAFYHDFQAEDSSEDFGSEVDLSIGWKAHERLTLLLKYADFNADSDRFSDTQKYWLMAQFKY